VATKCPQCQSENTDTARFCSNCAASLIPSEEISAPTETLEAAREELTTGSTFANRYQIIEELGKGGMGKVYKALDKEIDGKVALKLIKPEVAADKNTIKRFRNELKMARDIAHKNVCRMYDLNKEEGSYYITMEYVSGEDLKSFIRRSGQLAVGTTVRIAKEVCEGLSEAHKLGVVHRDLKPSNIMIDKEGNARIMDFGIARSIAGKGITGAGVMIGTPEYMSPEQAELKEVDQRSDIYSLGVILYEMVTGRVPFEGETPLGIAMKHKSEMPKDPKEINAQVPEDLSRVILRCMEKDKGKRYQSAGEVSSELEKIEKGIPTTERVVPKRKPITSKEITVTFGLKKLFIPAMIVVGIVIAGVIIWQLLPRKEVVPVATPDKPSLAVLPFVDLSPKKEHEFLCDGIAETLINALSGIKDLNVPARTSAFYFKDKDTDIREIGQKLNVEAVLEGSVQVVGDRLRMTARLSNVDDGYQLWSESYERQLEDVFDVQDDIAQKIVKALKIKLLDEQEAPLVKNYTKNLEAYSLYLQGRNFWNKRGEENLIKAIEYFEQAIEKDPTYALAYAGLADAYSVLGNNGIWATEKAYPKAKVAALKALDIDNKLPEAHTSLAMIILDYDWNFVGAEQELKLAIELNPGYATAHHWYAYFLSNMGRHDEASREIKIARKLDPLAPRIAANVGLLLYFARRYDQALKELNKALEADPNHGVTYNYLGWVYEAMGKYEEAVKFRVRGIELEGGSKDLSDGIARCYALMGKREEAWKILNNLIRYSKENYKSPVWIASVFAALGEKEEVFVWLEKAFRERNPGLVTYLKNHHGFDLVRSDPRFTDLLRRIGFEK